MGDGREEMLWDALNPAAVFRVRPADFRTYWPSVCSGVYYLPGLTSLLALPVAGLWGTWQLWPFAGGWSLLSLAPAVVVYAWLAAADVAFCRQSPTREEQAGFDNAVVNWFGLLATVVFWPAALLAGVVALACWWLAS